MLHFVASAPRGLTDLLAGELSGFGATDVRDRGSSVSFTGELAVGYRACLWSRTASRILLEVAHFEKKALATQAAVPPPLQQQHSGFTITVPETEAGSEPEPAT